MATQAQLEQNKERFATAKAQAEAEGGQVCGTYGPDGAPVYFVVPADTPDHEIELRAFRLKNGREPSEAERTIGRMVEKQMAKAG